MNKILVAGLLFCGGVANAGVTVLDDAVGNLRQVIQAPKPEWIAPAGSDVETILRDWAGKSNPKWTVVWEAEPYYELQAPMRFTGNFQEAAAAFVRAFEGSKQPLSATISPSQNAIYISSGASK